MLSDSTLAALFLAFLGLHIARHDAHPFRAECPGGGADAADATAPAAVEASAAASEDAATPAPVDAAAAAAAVADNVGIDGEHLGQGFAEALQALANSHEMFWRL